MRERSHFPRFSLLLPARARSEPRHHQRGRGMGLGSSLEVTRAAVAQVSCRVMLCSSIGGDCKMFVIGCVINDYFSSSNSNHVSDKKGVFRSE